MDGHTASWNTWEYWSGLKFSDWLKWKAYSWFTPDGWILHAHMDQIDFNSILDSDENLSSEFPTRPLTREEKANLLCRLKTTNEFIRNVRYRDEIVSLFKNDPEQNHGRKTFVHYLAWIFVVLISIASAFSVAPFVADLVQSAIGGPTRWVYALICLCTTWANIAVFRKNTTDVMKRLFCFGRPFSGLFIKDDKKIHVKKNKETQLNELTLDYPSQGKQDIEIKGWDKALLVFGFICALSMAATVAALNYVKTPKTLGAIDFLSVFGVTPIVEHMAAGGGHQIIAAILAVSSLFCVLSSLTFVFIKWSSVDNKGAKVRNFMSHLFGVKHNPDGSHDYSVMRIMTVSAITVLAIYGLATTAFVQTLSFTEYTGWPMEITMFIGMGLAFLGKLPFILNNITNVMALFANGFKLSEDSKDTVGTTTKAAILVNGIGNGILGMYGGADFVDGLERPETMNEEGVMVEDSEAVPQLSTEAPHVTAYTAALVGATGNSWGAATGMCSADTKNKSENDSLRPST